MTEIDFTLTDSAAKRLEQIITQQSLTPAHGLRITVEGGGCSGFQYKMDMDDQINDDDHIFENGSSKVIIDDISMEYLNASTLTFENSIGGAFLKIENPNASSSCGCGVSFDIKEV